MVTTSGSEAVPTSRERRGERSVVDVILETTGAEADDLSQSEIGPSWGDEVAKRSLIGLAVFLVLVVLFIWAYFRQKTSVAALVALAHDVVITVGIYALGLRGEEAGHGRRARPRSPDRA